jgi:hypothetical protein
MSRPVRILVAGAAAVVLAVVAAWIVLRAAREVRPFYQQALACDSTALEQGRRELQTQVGAFYSDAQETGSWSAVFTSAQLNGWLATELATVYADKLPADIREPRIAITPAALSLGFFSRHLGIETVVTVDADVFLTEDGELGARLTSVRAGALPLPVAQVAEEIQKASQKWALPLRWSQVDGEIVALVDIAGAVSSSEEIVLLHTLELREGEVYLAGQTVEHQAHVGEPAHPEARDPAHSNQRAGPLAQSDDQSTLQ